MRRMLAICSLLFVAIPMSAQGKRLWVLRGSGEMVEYDPQTFAVRGIVKVPPEAAATPQNVTVNGAGQILIVSNMSLPIADEDAAAPHKAWLWSGKASDGKTWTTIDLGVKREIGSTGSNQSVNELAPAVFLSSRGTHLYWFANSARRLERENFDLSIQTMWQAWRTDLSGGAREEIASVKLPGCECPTGACEETCPVGTVWVPEDGVGDFFLLTRFVAGKTGGVYEASTLYKNDGGKWTGTALAEPLRKMLDAQSAGSEIVEAIPDTGCCGWVNESDDQTIVRKGDKKSTVFDELTTYKNPDYDVSFFTLNAKLSPDLDLVAMTITATATVNQTIQLAEQGQANPEESKAIRKSLAELPAVEVKTADESAKRLLFVPHATLVGWISEKEMLLVSDNMLEVCNLSTGARKKSNVQIDDAAQAFLR